MAGISSFLTSCLSAHARRRFSLVAATAALALGGCGEDDEEVLAPPAVTSDTAQESTGPSTETGRTEGPREVEAETETAPARPSPEDQPGGAGDEEPARSQAVFTGRGGRITPRLVRVPPFISIRVELRSADGAAYALAARERTIRVDREITSASSTFAGLRPGRRLVLRAGGGRTVAVEASAEPGP